MGRLPLMSSQASPWDELKQNIGVKNPRNELSGQLLIKLLKRLSKPCYMYKLP